MPPVCVTGGLPETCLPTCRTYHLPSLPSLILTLLPPTHSLYTCTGRTLLTHAFCIYLCSACLCLCLHSWRGTVMGDGGFASGERLGGSEAMEAGGESTAPPHWRERLGLAALEPTLYFPLTYLPPYHYSYTLPPAFCCLLPTLYSGY